MAVIHRLVGVEEKDAEAHATLVIAPQGNALGGHAHKEGNVPMSMDQSQTLLVGRMASNPEKKAVGSSTVVEFRLATNHSYRDKNGAWQVGASSFFSVQCWDRLADNVVKSLSKGDPVIVSGRIVQSSWMTTGPQGEEQTRSAVRVRALHIGPDLNQRVASVQADAFKKEQEKTMQSRTVEEQTPQDQIAQSQPVQNRAEHQSAQNSFGQQAATHDGRAEEQSFALTEEVKVGA